MMKTVTTCACMFLALFSIVAVSAAPMERPLPPSDSAPSDWTRIPYYESRPEFVPTETEVQQGFVLFTRPIVDAIYPESRPGAEERVEKLASFAAGDQFQTLNFAVYPLQDLPKLQVEAGTFRTSDGTVFPSENIQVRLVTYRGIRFPQYNSKTKQYRILPEYLQEVRETDAPKEEPQRYFLTFHVPAGTQAGTYSGEVRVSWKNSSEESGSSVILPVSLRVLGFDLLRDPTKNYSAYYYPPQNADGTWNHEGMEREFAAMRDYGFTRSPVYSLRYDGEQKKLFFPEIDFWTDLMKRSGLTGPIPVIGGGGTWIAERDYGAKFASHIQVLTPPREEFFDELARQCADLKKETDAHSDEYPPMVFGPLDEISSESTDFGVRVYRTFHDAGLVTYTTKEPNDPSYGAYDDVVDIYASQMLRPLYDEVAAHHKREYWCYPNHNSYERKDPVIMCKGGRMTYGFGFWRSGFDLMIPWIWRASSPNHFDLGTSSGGNLLIPETNDVVMTTYWECFREGISDLRYLYTLETSVIQREGSENSEIQALVKESRALLQQIWDEIIVQDKYLNRNLWESERFDEYRTKIACLIERLNAFPAADAAAVAPSVIIEPRVVLHPDPLEDAFEQHRAAGTLQKVPVLAENCLASEDEAQVEVVSSPAGAVNPKCARLTVTIDKKHDGSGAKGLYPANWPALAGYADVKQMTHTPSALLLRVYITSNRTKNAGTTPIHVGISPGGYTFNADSELAENEWHTILVPLENAGYDGMPPVTELPSSVRLTISERNHEDGDVLQLYFDEISFVLW